jgi:hypothetical protein
VWIPEFIIVKIDLKILQALIVIFIDFVINKVVMIEILVNFFMSELTPNQIKLVVKTKKINQHQLIFSFYEREKNNLKNVNKYP